MVAAPLLHSQCVHGLSRVVAKEDPQTTVPFTGDIVRAYTQGDSYVRPAGIEGLGG